MQIEPKTRQDGVRQDETKTEEQQRNDTEGKGQTQKAKSTDKAIGRQARSLQDRSKSLIQKFDLSDDNNIWTLIYDENICFGAKMTKWDDSLATNRKRPLLFFF
jgi:hypothetical protein